MGVVADQPGRIATPVPAPKDGTTFSEIRDLTLVVAVFLFFIGFVYTATFYGHFGMRTSTLNLSINDIIVSSYNVISARPFILGCIGFGAAALAAALWLPKPLRVAAFALLAIGFLPFARTVGSDIAVRDAIATREGAFRKRAAVVFRPSAAPLLPKRLKTANREGRLRLLFETKESVFLFDQVDPGGDQLPVGHVYEVHREDVVALAVSVPNVSRGTKP